MFVITHFLILSIWYSLTDTCYILLTIWYMLYDTYYLIYDISYLKLLRMPKNLVRLWLVWPVLLVEHLGRVDGGLVQAVQGGVVLGSCGWCWSDPVWWWSLPMLHSSAIPTLGIKSFRHFWLFKYLLYS